MPAGASHFGSAKRQPIRARSLDPPPPALHFSLLGVRGCLLTHHHAHTGVSIHSTLESRALFGSEMPEYLVRLAQIHESFRKAELQALADLAETNIDLVRYDEDVGKLPRD